MKKLIILLCVCIFAGSFSSCKKEEVQRVCISCFGYKKCIFCDGTKICHVCGGEDLDILDCTFCNNTGRCQKCRATGRCLTCGGKGYIVN